MRDRRARGVRHVVQMEVDVDLLEFLERTGLVDRAEAANPSAVAFGLWMLLNEVVENHRIKETPLRRNIRSDAGIESNHTETRS